MPFNLQTFKTRTITGIVFVAVVLLGLLWNRWSFLLLISIIHFGCWIEYLRIIERINKAVFPVYTKIGFMVIGFGSLLFFCGSDYQYHGYTFKENLSLPVTAAGFAVLIIGIFQSKLIHLKAFTMAAGGLVYVTLCLGLMIDLNDLVLSRTITINGDESTVSAVMIFPFIIFITLWINDTMAYLVGSFFGKTPLTRISPKKTVEGTLGGFVLAVAAGGFLFSHFGFSRVIENYHWYIIALVIAGAGTIGDLFESKLKRMANVKDSGNILPGHGGFLDRFDSMLFATPAVWLYLMLVILS
jgi:phosphatidate cytidylyltransferase